MAKYETVVSDIKAQMLAGDLRPGDRLPATHELCSRYGVSKITVNRAMEVLSSEGLVIRKRGKGTFALTTPTAQASPDLVYEVHVFSAVKPNASVRDVLGLSFDEFCYYLVRTCNRAGVTLYVEYVFLPIRLTHALRAVHVEGDLYQMLERDLGLRVTSVQQTASAYAPNATEAKWLGCTTSDALVRIEEVARLENASAVVYATVVHAPGFSFGSISKG